MSVLHPQQGTKRKRGASGENVEDPAARIAGKLFHGLKEVKKAAKKAKAFETQRLVKRLKGISESEKGGDTKSELEVQLAALKKMSHDRIGAIALKNKLKKDKILSREPSILSAIPAELSEELLLASAGPEILIEGRLFSSKALSAEVNSIISSLRSIIRPEPAVALEAETELDPSSKKTRIAAETFTGFSVNEDPPARASDDSEDTSDDDDDEHDGGWESGTVDEETGLVFQTQGGVDSNEHDGDASSISGARPAHPTSTTAGLNVKSKAVPLKQEPKVKGSQSTFLPSLSTGFIPGNSDSDCSDGEAEVADPVHKNRRGQRARRAIWEKKYGRGAKHLNKDSERSVPASQASQRRLGRGPQNPHNTSTNQSHPDRRESVHALPPRSDYDPRPKSDVERPLHPSWEAKKKLKERESGAIIPPQGTRITFDD